jgi:hypothetical protein
MVQGYIQTSVAVLNSTIMALEQISKNPARSADRNSCPLSNNAERPRDAAYPSPRRRDTRVDSEMGV